MIDKNGCPIATFGSLREASRITNYPLELISYQCRTKISPEKLRKYDYCFHYLQDFIQDFENI